jgi:hypothetical protein
LTLDARWIVPVAAGSLTWDPNAGHVKLQGVTFGERSDYLPAAEQPRPAHRDQQLDIELPRQ